MIPNYNKQWSIVKKFEELIKLIQKKAEKSGKICAVLIDEMPPSFFEECPDYQEFLQALFDEWPFGSYLHGHKSFWKKSDQGD